MKKFGLNFLKVLLIIILFPIPSVASPKTELSKVKLASTLVTSSNVVQYLEGLGYSVLQIISISGTNNWLAITCDSDGNYWVTTVYYSSSNGLLGHENDTL